MISLSGNVIVSKSANIIPTKPYLFAFWHGKQYLAATRLIIEHQTEMCAMASPSSDGSILSILLEKNGYSVVRGSSSNTGVRALISMGNKLKSGASIGFGVDGPKGPIHKTKPGIIYLAQKYNIPIISVGSEFSKKWIFEKAWDKFELPKFFSKGALVLSDPYVVGKEISIENACLELETRLNAANIRAYDLVFG